MERATIEQSDLVLAVTSSSLEEIAGRYREQPARKFARVANGYDPETFRSFQARPHEGNKVVITHMGTAYKSSSPQYFLRALDLLPEAIRNSIEVRFIGRVAETELGLFEARRDSIKVLGFMPQEQALRRVEETDFLLLTMTNEYSLPGKLFEYMAMGKPVLAISPKDGEVDRILKETGAGWCAEPQDSAGIQALIRRAYEMVHLKRESFAPDWEAVRRYERPRLAGELAGLIEDRLSQ
jgi:glycosyltransferase involved in cell wall biosynthesis